MKFNKYWFSYKRLPWSRLFGRVHFPISWEGYTCLFLMIILFPISAFILLPEDRNPTYKELIPFIILMTVNVITYIIIDQLKSQPDPKTKNK